MTAVEIDRIAAGGEGVGRLEDGCAVFVHRTAPGDRVEIDLVERKRRYARGRLRTVERPGADRVAPACPHYDGDDCGGCQLQHLGPEGQHAAKRGIVGDALRRIGRRPIDDPPLIAGSRAWEYRTKIALSVSSDRRRVGYHRYGRPDAVFQLRDCRLASPALRRLWEAVLAHRDRLPDQTTGVVLREDEDGNVHVVVEGGTAPFDPADLHQGIGIAGLAVWWQPARGAPRIVAGRETGYPALAFRQTSADLADRIRDDAVARLGDLDGRVVWDLYGGLGATARALADRGARVWCVDVDRTAIAWAGDHVAPHHRITFLAAPVEETLHRLPAPDAVVVNPPRVGLHRRVAQALERWAGTQREEGRGARRLAYQSCDPATLARDLTRLPSFALATVTAYDLFPQTAHVETLALLGVPCDTP